MTTLELENPATMTPAEKLRTTAAAVRVSFSWFGNKKVVTGSVCDEIANAVEANKAMLSTSKLLLDNKSAPLKALTQLRNRITKFWKAITLPYTETGIRLIRQDSLDSFTAQMENFRQDLAEAEDALVANYEQLKASAKDRLGHLYVEADYPANPKGSFSVDWDFPSVEPPDYLLQVRPDLYERERQRVAAKFEQAVTLAEQSFAVELANLVDTLKEKLTDTGEKKVLKSSSVENFQKFFERFKLLNVNSNAELDKLVQKAEDLISGVEASEIRTQPELQAQIREGMEAISGQLDPLLVNVPRRKIVRRKKETEDVAAS